MEKCEWRITATHGERIVLNITELDIAKSESCRLEQRIILRQHVEPANDFLLINFLTFYNNLCELWYSVGH